jgi:hypothetical protein
LTGSSPRYDIGKRPREIPVRLGSPGIAGVFKGFPQQKGTRRREDSLDNVLRDLLIIGKIRRGTPGLGKDVLAKSHHFLPNTFAALHNLGNQGTLLL